jgi:hypothetical protein
MPSRTINRLHFTDLDPLRFEDLCLNLISRLHKWKELNHFGRKGKDSGVDIYAVLEENEIDKHWYIQCKRYSKITKRDIENVITSIDFTNSTMDKFLLIISCDISRDSYNHFKKLCIEKQIETSMIWSATTLEAKLYEEHQDLLFVYFGLRLENKKPDNAARIRYSLKMQKKIQKDFIDHEVIKNQKVRERLYHQPYLKFISSRVYIRSIDDTTYPECLEPPTGQMSPWIKEHLYDLYQNGIEICIAAAIGHKIIMDSKGYWEVLKDYFDKRQEDPKYKTSRVKLIGQIPFYSIVDYKLEGDEYSNDPHIFCRFEFNNTPYIKFYYKIYADENTDLPFWELDEKKKIIFPKKSNNR